MSAASSPPFTLTSRFTAFLAAHHIAAHPADLALDPPESYLHIQDGIIVACAIAWMWVYVFLIRDTIRHKGGSIPVHCYAFNLAYELYYGLLIPKTSLGRLVFVAGWFLLDAVWVGAVGWFMTGPERRRLALVVAVEGAVLLGVYEGVRTYGGVDIQCGAYWFGILAHFVDCVGLVVEVRRKEPKILGRAYRSLEFQLMGWAGFVLAILVFAWRYFNVPENWGYVASLPSITAWLACLGLMLYSTVVVALDALSAAKRSVHLKWQ